jgi:hypothetical protein
MQRLQKRVLRATGNIDKCTPVRELHVAFEILFIYDNLTKLCRIQAEVILQHVNPNVRGIGQEKPGTGSKRDLNLAALRPTTVQLIAVSE